MKKITKIITAILAVAMLSMSFAGCGLVEDTDVVEKVKIQKETVLTVGDGIEISGAYYGWYFANAYDAAYSEEASKAEAEADSAADSSATSTAAEAPAEINVDMEAVKKQAIDDIVAVKMACAKAKEAGIKLTSEDMAFVSSQVENYRSQVISQYAQQGMEISYQDFLLVMNTNADTVAEIFEDEYMASMYYASLVSDEYVTAKHILIKYGEDSRTKDEAKKLADDIIAELDGGADFDALMNEHSEDGRDASGNLSAPDGYTFTKDSSYMQAFKDATFALEEGKVSAPVNVEDYYSGYHIIKRVATPVSKIAQSLENNDKIDAEREKLVSDVKIVEGKRISYYLKAYAD